MLTSFVLSMALAAPVPAAPAAPIASGPAPRLMELKADADGKVMVTVIRTELVKVKVGRANAINPGGAAPAVVTREVPVKKSMTVEVGEVKDLKVTTADGKKVDVADAVKKLKDGVVVVVSSDGNAVSPIYLKAFKDDVLVLAAPELAGASQTTPGRPGIRPLPAPIPAPGIVPAQPGVIQIQIQPGNIQLVPAPAPAPEK